MDILILLKNVLSDPEIINLLPDGKVFMLHADTPNKSLYLEYQVIDEYGEEYSENEERYTGFIVQVDIFSAGDYVTLSKIVKAKMKEAGFIRDSSADLYEKDTKLFHKAMRFTISLETEE